MERKVEARNGSSLFLEISASLKTRFKEQENGSPETQCRCQVTPRRLHLANFAVKKK